MNGTVFSFYSGQISVTPWQAPGAPTGLQAVAASPMQIRLTWVDNSTTETRFRVERQNGGSWVEVAKTHPDKPAFIDTGRAAGTFSNYRVRAMSGTTVSAPSPEAGDTALP